MTATRMCAALAVVIVSGCAPTPEEPALFLSADRGAFDGRLERLVLRVKAFGVGGSPGEGSVRLSAPVGHFIGGDEVVLADGFATATYACDPDEDRACNGTVRLSGVWGALNASTQVTLSDTIVIEPVKWQVVSTASLDELVALAVAPDGSAWAVGARGTVRHLVGRAWQVVPSPVRSDLRALAFDADGKAVIVGDDGVVLREQAGQLAPLPLELSDDVSAVAIGPGGELLLGTTRGVLSTIDAENRLVPQLDLRAPVRAMARQGADVWAAADGALARYSEGAWFNLPMPVSAQFTFAQAGASNLWLGGFRQGATTQQGVLLAGPSPTWRSVTLPAPVQGFAEVPGADERFALSSVRLYRQIGASDWDEVALPAGMSAIASRAPGDLVLVGPPGFSLLRTR